MGGHQDAFNDVNTGFFRTNNAPFKVARWLVLSVEQSAMSSGRNKQNSVNTS